MTTQLQLTNMSYHNGLIKIFFSFIFPNRELLRCGLFSVVRELETTSFGGEEVGRCSTLVALGTLVKHTCNLGSVFFEGLRMTQ